MSAAQTRLVIENELGAQNMSEVFSSIDLDKPLGSATIAQVRYICIIWTTAANLSRVRLRQLSMQSECYRCTELHCAAPMGSLTSLSLSKCNTRQHWT